MKQLLKILGLVLSLCCLNLNSTAEAAVQSQVDLAAFEDGDIVGFIGDSITHARYCDMNYPEIMNQYYLCRFPERKVEFRNLGVAGYKACDILNIYDLDPGFQGINKAVIMLGTNEAILKYSAEKYISDVDRLISRLKEDGLAGEDILLLTPPFCHEKMASSSLFKIENTLLGYINELEARVPQWGVHYLDIHTPMAELTKEMQKENSENTLTTDGIHPNANGQMLMAYSILTAQDVGNVMVIAPENNPFPEEYSTFCRTEKGMFGTFVQETLPWSVTEELLDFLEFYKPADSLYQELLQVNGFDENIYYQVFVNDVGLGSFTGKELAEGINLASLITHPSQPHVQQLTELRRQQHKTAVAYRDIWIDVMMQRVTYTPAQAQAKYDNWREKDNALREEMAALSRSAVGNTCSLVIVEAGYPAVQLEKDYQKEQEQARKKAEEQATHEAEERARREAEALAQREAAQKEAERAAAQTAIIELCLKAFMIAAMAATLSLPFILSRSKKNTKPLK